MLNVLCLCSTGKMYLPNIDFERMFCSAQKVYQANAESFNGAIRDNYSWSQSITDTDLRINVSQISSVCYSSLSICLWLPYSIIRKKEENVLVSHLSPLKSLFNLFSSTPYQKKIYVNIP